MVEAVHQLYLLPHVESVGLVFVHLEHHHLSSHEVSHLVHFTEEASTKFFRLKVI